MVYLRMLSYGSRLRGGRDGGDLNPGYANIFGISLAPGKVAVYTSMTGVLHNSLHNIIVRGLYAVSGQARLRTGTMRKCKRRRESTLKSIELTRRNALEIYGGSTVLDINKCIVCEIYADAVAVNTLIYYACTRM